ncbi:MAG: hypothetical protein KY431_10160 [Actinobacteria bacterium]|nr:hypothetical protein [Actinomycetota bacterium]
METSGLIPDTFVAAPELADLAASPGSYASIYLTTEAAVDNAGPRVERRWKTLRASLAEQGAGEEVLEAVDGVVPSAHLQGQALAVIADTTGIRHLEHDPEPLPGDIAQWGPLPALLPLLEWRQASPPHVVVLADRQGADLVAVRRQGPDLHREAGGEDYPLRKVGPGGWSQRRFQQRAENTWEDNAADVAEELVELVDRVNARLVVLGGDVRALQLLREAVPDRVAGMLREAGGGRSADGSGPAIEAEVTRLVDERVAEETAQVLEKFAEERGQNDRAVEGAAATLGALALGQVDGLLIDSGLDETPAWFGPEPLHVGASRDDLGAMGVAAPEQAPLVDVVIRAALGAGAGVRIVPPEHAPAGGLGGLLRWAP